MVIGKVFQVNMTTINPNDLRLSATSAYSDENLQQRRAYSDERLQGRALTTTSAYSDER